MSAGRRVLVVRTGAMGDVLHALPAVTALRHAEPTARIDWVVDPRWAPLLVDGTGAGPVVSRVHMAETKTWSTHPISAATAQSILRLRRALKAACFTQVIDLQGTLRSAIVGRMAGSGERAGFDDPREQAARIFYTRPLPRQGAHIVEQNAALLGSALGVRLRPVMPSLPVCEAAEGWAARMSERFGAGTRFALLAPGAGWGAKQWPAERFAALARVLAGRDLGVLVNAAGADFAIVDEIVRNSAGAAHPVPCDVAQLIALTRRAAVVIGGDSGPVHLAAALGRPVVALFGPTDPARNGPWGTGRMQVLRDPASITSYKRRPGVDAGLSRMPVERVTEAVWAVCGLAASGG